MLAYYGICSELENSSLLPLFIILFNIVLFTFPNEMCYQFTFLHLLVSILLPCFIEQILY